MLRYDFDESVGYWICMTSQAFRKTLSAKLAEAGMTFRQWEVLAWLACDESVSQADLAECMGIEAPTLAGVLRRMERDGWLLRRTCVEDRRCNRLEPTEKAEEIWNRAVAICQQVRSQATAGFTPAELVMLKKLCGDIRENLAIPDPTCQPCEEAASRERAAVG